MYMHICLYIYAYICAYIQKHKRISMFYKGWVSIKISSPLFPCL